MNKKHLPILLLLSFSIQIVVGQVDFKADIIEGCTPMKVKFSIDSASVDVSQINYLTWHFGEGDTLNSLNPDTVVYEREGNYTVRLVMNGVRDSATIKENYIKTHKTVHAAFELAEIGENYQYRFIPFDNITDSSTIYFYSWRYYDSIPELINTSDYPSITLLTQSRAIDTFSFESAGNYRVTLRIIDQYDCASTLSKTLTIADEITLPNIFITSLQDFYIINPNDAATILNFTVFSRTGALVFNQTSPIINWDGRSNNGVEISDAVYYYVLEATQGDPLKKYSKKGFIHVYH